MDLLLTGIAIVAISIALRVQGVRMSRSGYGSKQPLVSYAKGTAWGGAFGIVLGVILMVIGLISAI